MLATRLNEVLSDTISENQSAFILGRQILDVALIANEVVEDIRSQGNLGLVFKLDFEKAYDQVCWGFLDRKEFGKRWRNWILGCLSVSSFALLLMVNLDPGSKVKEV